MRGIRRSAWKLLIVAALFGGCAWLYHQGRQASLRTPQYLPAIILDAGHGGEDGGAVSPGGIKESDINLSITLKLDQMLGLLGETPILLREEDLSLHDDTAVTIREKKVSDLKNRTAATNALPTATLVSIHQNSYPDPKYKGTQVFYAPTGGSEQLAKAIQQCVSLQIQPNNTRQPKPVPDSVYLMNHIANRAVLVECGFLTNPEEETLLQQTEYQCKLALVLAVTLSNQFPQ